MSRIFMTSLAALLHPDVVDVQRGEAEVHVLVQPRRVLPEVLTGCSVADMVAVLGSMFFVVGDVDK